MAFQRSQFAGRLIANDPFEDGVNAFEMIQRARSEQLNREKTLADMINAKRNADRDDRSTDASIRFMNTQADSMRAGTTRNNQIAEREDRKAVTEALGNIRKLWRSNPSQAMMLMKQWGFSREDVAGPTGQAMTPPPASPATPMTPMTPATPMTPMTPATPMTPTTQASPAPPADQSDGEDFHGFKWKQPTPPPDPEESALLERAAALDTRRPDPEESALLERAAALDTRRQPDAIRPEPSAPGAGVANVQGSNATSANPNMLRLRDKAGEVYDLDLDEEDRYRQERAKNFASRYGSKGVPKHLRMFVGTVADGIANGSVHEGEELESLRKLANDYLDSISQGHHSGLTEHQKFMHEATAAAARMQSLKYLSDQVSDFSRDRGIKESTQKFRIMSDGWRKSLSDNAGDQAGALYAFARAAEGGGRALTDADYQNIASKIQGGTADKVKSWFQQIRNGKPLITDVALNLAEAFKSHLEDLRLHIEKDAADFDSRFLGPNSEFAGMTGNIQAHRTGLFGAFGHEDQQSPDKENMVVGLKRMDSDRNRKSGERVKNGGPSNFQRAIEVLK